MLQNNPALKSKIDQLWNKFWAGGIANPLTAIEQITYLLFMKRLDDLYLKQQADADFTGDSFTSRFAGTWVPPEHRFSSNKKDPEEARREKAEREKPFEIDRQTLRWSEFKRMAAEEMINHMQGRVFPFLKDINGRESHFTEHMKNAMFMISKPSLLVEAVKTIDAIYEEIEKDSREKGQAFQDIQGDVYEYLLSEIAQAGKNGQFRTPRHIIKLMAELVQPQLGHRICDPACGTGGFVLGAFQYIVTQLAVKKGAKNFIADEDGFVRTSVSAGLTEKAKHILNESLWGYDFDSTMVRLGLMNLMMHGIDEPHVDYSDTLSKKFNATNQYDIVMANPPFTGSIDKGDINESLSLKTTKTELLFVETIYRLLKKAYDHYLPKAKYPFNAINFHNLAPACHECNSTYKLSKDPLHNAKDPLQTQNGGRRKSFYPYQTSPFTIALEISLEAEDWTKIEPDNVHIATGPDTIREEIDTWLDVYGIEERYKAKCCGDDDGKYWIEQVLDEWTTDGKTPEGFLSTLSRQARSKPFAEANFLKLAFLEGCHRSGLFI